MASEVYRLASAAAMLQRRNPNWTADQVAGGLLSLIEELPASLTERSNAHTETFVRKAPDPADRHKAPPFDQYVTSNELEGVNEYR